MNYPIWDVPASGLFIAVIAVIHVFISHFAIGGGLFLVWYETRARGESDRDLLEYVRIHSRFFLMLTLVLGTLTGVAIWFTIGLVQPQATSTLIQFFVWGWAIEWTFFVVEIAAAMVYYYGWDRLSSRAHLVVGWIYFVAAWMSLFVINGILTFMLTPGRWVLSRSLFDAFFNPTFWPSLLARTLICVGLAGLYALLTASYLGNQQTRIKVIRAASLYWLIPAGVLLPISFMWYLSSAAGAGVPVAEILGAAGPTLPDIVSVALFGAPSAGYPHALTAVFLGTLAFLIIALSSLVLVFMPSLARPSLVLPLFLLGLVAFGGFEWVREDLRKPYVIGHYMFVNGIRLPLPDGVSPGGADPFSVTSLNERGVLSSSRWSPPQSELEVRAPDGQDARGKEVFRLLCSSCHTLDGHLAIQPLLAGKTQGAIDNILQKLALPVDASGNSTSWDDPDLRLQTWRGRRMPPFVGTEAERGQLANYLAGLAGTLQAEPAGSLGQQVFDEACAFCHGAEADWPMTVVGSGKSYDDFVDRLSRLPEINPIMPPFEGTDAERDALAHYLVELASGSTQEQEVQ
jgi:mono/diheme cytochrome c family protein